MLWFYYTELQQARYLSRDLNLLSSYPSVILGQIQGLNSLSSKSSYHQILQNATVARYGIIFSSPPVKL